jgi:putative ABC transport system ATP-binding protein
MILKQTKRLIIIKPVFMIQLQKTEETIYTDASQSKTMIRLKNIAKVYRTDTVETLALNNINIDISKGAFLSIMGPSGCGKSTLLNIMGLLDAPTKGEVKIDQQKTGQLSDRRLAGFRNKKLGFIFQSYHLINDLKVIDNVELPLLYRKLSAKERRRLATEALEKVGLSNRMKHFPTQLSGGQKQRVAIARAIVGAPEIILADEPTGNLDSAMGNEIMDILLYLNKTEGTTIVMVTHDEIMANKTHQLIRLFDGSQVL